MQTREEQPNMEGLLYASQSRRELITVVKAKRVFHSLFIAFAEQYVPIGTGAVGSVSSQPGSGPTFK